MSLCAVLGPTDPAKAPATSLRGMLFADWEKLGLEAAPNTTDNGVHASASPFEALAERLNWMKASLKDDAFGKAMLDSGIPKETIMAWTKDPQARVLWGRARARTQGKRRALHVPFHRPNPPTPNFARTILPLSLYLNKHRFHC